jgi:hypothetical protein
MVPARTLGEIMMVGVQCPPTPAPPDRVIGCDHPSLHWRPSSLLNHWHDDEKVIFPHLPPTNLVILLLHLHCVYSGSTNLS